MRASGEANALLLIGCAVLLAGMRHVPLRRLHRLAGLGRMQAGAPVARRGVRIGARVVMTIALLACLIAIFVGTLGIAALVVAFGCTVLLRDRQRRCAAERSRRGCVEAVRLLAAELEAGASLQIALRAAAQVEPAYTSHLALAANALSAGDDVDMLLAAAEPALVGVGHACRIGAVSGARLAPVFAAIVRDANALDRRRRAVATALAGPRSSCVLLALLPVLGTLLGVAIGAHPWTFLLGSRAGREVCCAGAVLDVLGLLWMRRIMRKAERL